MDVGTAALEELVTDRPFWAGRRVFLTGHTGFKGGWLALWLDRMGAEVHGYALAPPTEPSLFEAARVADHLASHTIADIRDAAALAVAVAKAEPEIVFHLAAQPLVRQSYADPLETYATNVMGTVNLHEAVRRSASAVAFVNVTTDKCYDNREWQRGYREEDALGGRDPYSTSKAGSELVTAAYRASFHEGGAPWIASARAGNVIGGGDWAADRLVPDIFRALDAGETLVVRHPEATRPWQHVLEPLSGYLAIAERLVRDGAEFARAWNFGPDDEDAKPVRWILDQIHARCPALRWRQDEAPQVHEAQLLKLDSSLAREALGWRPRWPLATALDKTIEWHEAWRSGANVEELCQNQIEAHEAEAGR